MSEWNTNKLEDITQRVCVGFVGTCQKDYTEKENGVMMIRTTNLDLFRLNLSNVQYISKEFHLKNKKSQLKRNDILIARHGDNGKASIYELDEEANCLNVVIIRPDESKANANFLVYLINSPYVKDLILSQSSGSVQDVINTKAIASLELPIPDLPTQSRIASILSSLDNKIELNRRMNQTLEQMAQALFNHYFVNNIDPDNLPEGWRWGKLEEMVNVKGGTTPSTKEPSFWNGDIHWTSPRDLSSLSFPVLLDTEKKITEKGLKKISSGLLPKGTLLLSSRAPIGYLAITEIPVAINQGYIAIDCSKGYSNLFMLYWLKTNMNILIQNANGSTFLEVSKSVFRNIDVVIPSLEQVEKYDTLVSSMFSMIVSNEKENKTLSKIRDTLLPKLMSGEIDVDTLMKEEAISQQQTTKTFQPT